MVVVKFGAGFNVDIATWWHHGCGIEGKYHRRLQKQRGLGFVS